MADKLSSTELARELASRRRIVVKICPECGTNIEGITTRIFCGNICANRAYRKRHREELNKRRMERYYRLKRS